VQLNHIPYEGELDTPVLGGHITFAGANVTASLVEAGKLRLLLMHNDEKSADYPDVPILKDLGYNIPWPMKATIIAPRAVPDAIIKKLEDAVANALKTQSFIQSAKKIGLPIVYKSSKELENYIPANYAYYAKVFKEKGLIK
jgi:tripartite-type tricarboxylate transporter receptor subunit TctC